MIAVLVMAALFAAADPESGAPPEPETIAAPAQTIAPGITLLPGDFPRERGPDGNTVIFEAPQGLVIFDTGRHAWHSDAILTFAQTQGRPIAAIINSHWHLDHSSGNGRIKAAFPNATVYATNAVDGAIAGFLADNLRQAQAAVGGATGVEAEEMQLFIDTMAHADTLRPDIQVSRSGQVRIGGRRFDLRVTDHAVTDADIWLYDRASRVAVIGDLVTLPAPFFETACSARWREALDQVWATPFRTAIPGHGPPMTRANFNIYRLAFGAFLDCVHSDASPATCSANWAHDVTPLLSEPARASGAAAHMAAYYVSFLRAHGGNGLQC